MKVLDADNGRELASIVGDEILLPKGQRYKIEGMAVVDVDGIVGEPDKVVAILDDQIIYNNSHQKIAVVEVTKP